MTFSKQCARYIGMVLIVAMAALLYLPFAANPPVFDDGFIYSGIGFAYYATHPLGLGLRVPSYFSLAITQMLFASIFAHRLVSLALHIACALVLYKVISELTRVVLRSGSPAATDSLGPELLALGAAAVFVIHPVAVYGAGYLVQRTILLATLFSMLSTYLFFRGLVRNSHADALSAALMYSMAVLCKEHSLMAPATALLLLLLVPVNRRFALRHAAMYLLACLPAAIFVVMLAKGVIASSYEPEVAKVSAQMQGSLGIDAARYPLWISVINQAGLFFRYLGTWLWPASSLMSVDIRVNFSSSWPVEWLDFRIAAFLVFGTGCFLMLRRGGRWGLAGFGLLYAWLHFLVEFGAVRFQEPFVLYRSYLWAPGIVIAAAAAMTVFSRAALIAIFMVACPLLFYLAHERLVTFSNPVLLWEDAVAKLPSTQVPWGSRTMSLLVGEYLREGQPAKAIHLADLCIKQYPDTAQCYFSRGIVHLTTEEYERSLEFLYRARDLAPEHAVTLDRIGIALENLDRIDEAKAYYRRALALGYKGSGHRISRLDNPGSGLLPPKRRSVPVKSPPEI
jgi:hypothetical protein